MGNKKTVQFTVHARYEVSGEVEMDEEEFNEWCEKIDNAKGFARERLAQELCLEAGVDYRDGDIDDEEIEEFNWA